MQKTDDIRNQYLNECGLEIIDIRKLTLEINE